MTVAKGSINMPLSSLISSLRLMIPPLSTFHEGTKKYSEKPPG